MNRLRTQIAKEQPEGGFTLIELLIVIVILGVLAGIVVFAVGGINDSSKKSACKSDVKNVETAQEAYWANHKAYAGDVGALVTDKLLREAPSGTPAVTTDSTGAVYVGAADAAHTIGTAHTSEALCG
jgi:prepilin-type N-terminal cleavage/methylation domain-containing protein